MDLLLRASFAEGGPAASGDAPTPSRPCATDAGGWRSDGCCCCCGTHGGGGPGGGGGGGGEASPRVGPRPSGQPVLFHWLADPKGPSDPARLGPVRPEASHRLGENRSFPGPLACAAVLASGDGSDHSDYSLGLVAADDEEDDAFSAEEAAEGRLDDDTLAALAMADNIVLGSGAPAPVSAGGGGVGGELVFRIASGGGGGQGAETARGARGSGGGGRRDAHFEPSREGRVQAAGDRPVEGSVPSPSLRVGAVGGGRSGPHRLVACSRASSL
jgi:hypothetical protein